jgi:DNA repair protein RadC
VCEIGESLEVRVVDHLIVTPKGDFASFRRHGWMQ